MVALQTLLEKIKQTPISLETIRQKLPPRCKAVQYKSLTEHRSKVFANHDVVVVLIPKKGEILGHFIVLLAKRNHIEYFSSLGGTPDSEMEKLGEHSQIIKRLLGSNYIVNTKKLQSGEYRIEDCAVWVLVRCYLRKLKLREFQQLFQRRVVLQTPDDIVACLGVLLLIDVESHVRK